VAFCLAIRNQSENVNVESTFLRSDPGHGAFDGLFKHLPYNDAGSFACRWERVLKRLQDTELETLVCEIRKHITVLK
jgi:hypothetical protein